MTPTTPFLLIMTALTLNVATASEFSLGSVPTRNCAQSVRLLNGLNTVPSEVQFSFSCVEGRRVDVFMVTAQNPKSAQTYRVGKISTENCEQLAVQLNGMNDSATEGQWSARCAANQLSASITLR